MCAAVHPLSKVTLWTQKEAEPCSGCQKPCISFECSTFQRNCEDCHIFSRLPVEEDVDGDEELEFIRNAVYDDQFLEARNGDILDVFDSTSDVTGMTTMDTTAAIISDLQQNITAKSVGQSSRILNAKLKATKSASRSRKNKVQAPKSRSCSATLVNNINSSTSSNIKSSVSTNFHSSFQF